MTGWLDDALLLRVLRGRVRNGFSFVDGGRVSF